MYVKGMFRGKNVGRRVAKMWNHLHNRRGQKCIVCGVGAGSFSELMKHYASRHPEVYLRYETAHHYGTPESVSPSELAA